MIHIENLPASIPVNTTHVVALRENGKNYFWSFEGNAKAATITCVILGQRNIKAFHFPVSLLF